jgi:hypothetical protein
MRVTIIRDDGVVGVDGVFRKVDLAALPDGVRAVQWSGAAGHVEFADMRNADITSISEFQSSIDGWAAAAPVPTAPQPPQIPTKVQMAQARLALLQQGYLDQVNAILAGLTGDAGKAAQIEWNYRQYVDRNNHLVQAIKAQLPLTEQQLDDLFTLASTL